MKLNLQHSFTELFTAGVEAGLKAGKSLILDNPLSFHKAMEIYETELHNKLEKNKSNNRDSST